MLLNFKLLASSYECVAVVVVVVVVVVAKLNCLDFRAASFSYAGQMDVVIKNLFLQQIKFKLQLVDGEVKKSKVRAIMKHCVRHISAAINRSASRNILLSSSKPPNWSIWHFGTP